MMRAYTTLVPGGHGDFLPTYYDREEHEEDRPYYTYGTAGDTVPVFDPFHLNCIAGDGTAGLGEVAWVTYDYYRRQYVVVGSQGLVRWANLDAELDPNSSAAVDATITITDHTGGTLDTIEIQVYAHAPSQGDPIPSGAAVQVVYDSAQRRWKCGVSYREPPP